MTRGCGPARVDGVHVLNGRCDTCIFRRGNLMRLRAGRLAEMIRAARERDTVIVCHETYDVEQAVCRGFWDTQRQHVWPLRYAQKLGLIVFDPPPRPTAVQP